MERDVDMSDCGGGKLAAMDEIFEEQTLIIGKGNGVFALPHDDNILPGTIYFLL